MQREKQQERSRVAVGKTRGCELRAREHHEGIYSEGLRVHPTASCNSFRCLPFTTTYPFHLAVAVASVLPPWPAAAPVCTSLPPPSCPGCAGPEESGRGDPDAAGRSVVEESSTRREKCKSDTEFESFAHSTNLSCSFCGWLLTSSHSSARSASLFRGRFSKSTSKGVGQTGSSVGSWRSFR